MWPGWGDPQPDSPDVVRTLANLEGYTVGAFFNCSQGLPPATLALFQEHWGLQEAPNVPRAVPGLRPTPLGAGVRALTDAPTLAPNAGHRRGPNRYSVAGRCRPPVGASAPSVAPMHICILNVLHTPLDKRVFQKVAKSLAAAGHEVTTIVPSAAAIADRDGVRFLTTPVVRSLAARTLAVLRLVRRGRSVRCAAYLAVEPESWVAALVLKMVTGRKVVFDVHEPIPSEFAKFFPAAIRPLVSWATVRAMRLFARYTDHIILTRESLDAEFKGLKVPRTVVLNTNHLQPKCEMIPEDLRTRFSAARR